MPKLVSTQFIVTESINTAGNPTIGTTVVIKNTDLSRLIEKSYRNLDTLMKELEANGIDTSQLNIIEE